MPANRKSTLLICLILGSYGLPVTQAEGPVKGGPAWLAAARWYCINVDRFRNGSTANDPAGVLPWTATAGAVSPSARYGGDLQGLKEKLPYLQSLKVNAICLSSVFGEATERLPGPTVLRHIDDTYGVSDSINKMEDETVDVASWALSQSDRLLLDLVAAVHAQGMRLVIELPRGVTEALSGDEASNQPWAAALQRWMDPDGDGTATDGVDGWIIPDNSSRSREGIARLYKLVAGIKPDGAVLLSAEMKEEWDQGNQPAIVPIDHQTGAAVARFFRPGNTDYSLKSLFGNLTSATSPTVNEAALRSPLAYESPPITNTKEKDASQATLADLTRLAMAFHLLLAPTPMLYYGDEVGLRGDPRNGTRGPMWWNDSSDPAALPDDYRGDLFAVARLMHGLREQMAPLQRGRVRAVKLDAERKVLAFARSHEHNEVVVVINYSDQPQRVTISAKLPGKRVGIITPQIRPPTRRRGPSSTPPEADLRQVPSLRVTAARTMADDWGDVTIWISPLAVRLLLLE